MAAQRGHATRAALALWVLVLVADVAAGGSAAVLAALTGGAAVAVIVGTGLIGRTGLVGRTGLIGRTIRLSGSGRFSRDPAGPTRLR